MILSILESIGLPGLVPTPSGENAKGHCPAHRRITGHHDRSPSWYVHTVTGQHHCFSCGWSGTLEDIFREVNVPVPPDLMTWLTTEQVKASLNRLAAAEDPDDEEAPSYFKPTVVDEIWLDSFDEAPDDMMAERFISPEMAKLYKVKWSEAGLYLPIRNSAGVLQGVQIRRPGSFPLNHPKTVLKSESLFGLNVASMLGRAVLLVESPLDVVRCATAAVPAVASYGVFVSAQQLDMLASHFDVVVLGLDNPAIDPAGASQIPIVTEGLTRRSVHVLQFRYDGLTKLDGSVAKDPGDVADSEALHTAWKTSLSYGMAV